MASAFLIFLAVVAVLILIGAVIRTAIEFQDAIFGSIVVLVGLGIVAGGIALLVRMGGGVGAFGIFVALFGAVIVWFGQAIVRNTL